MRTTDYTFGPTLAGKAAAASRRNGLVALVSMVWRAMRNRHALMRLDELDDRRLLDLGLCREDVRSARTSAISAPVASRVSSRKEIICASP